MKARVWFVLIAFLVAAGAGAVSVSALEGAQETAATLGPNLLFNPSFEGYYDYQPYVPPEGHPDCDWGICMTANLAPGWTPYWRSHDPADPEWIIRMPEYKPASAEHTDPVRVRTGTAAQAYFTFHGTHEAGFYQRVSVISGTTYCFSIWGHSWSGSNDGDAYTDLNHGNFRQRVGIDPTGGTDWLSGEIRWGGLRIQPDYYAPFVVTATAQTDAVTVYAYSQPEWAMENNDAYWDDASLRQVEPVLPDGQLAFTVIPGGPLHITKTVNPDWLCDPETRWEVTPDSEGEFLPGLSATSGTAGDVLAVTLSVAGLSRGQYDTMLHFSSPDTGEALPAIPVHIDVQVDLTHLYLPAMIAGQ